MNRSSEMNALAGMIFLLATSIAATAAGHASFGKHRRAAKKHTVKKIEAVK